MDKLIRLVIICLALVPIGGCVSLMSDFREPGVTFVSIAPRIANGISPQFDIVLRVTNPNRNALDIVGLTYTIHLAGNRVIDGVASDLPRIAAYGEADVTLSASANLLNGLNLLAGMLASPGNQIDYEFNAQIDIGTFYPMIDVNRTGVIAFQ